MTRATDGTTDPRDLAAVTVWRDTFGLSSSAAAVLIVIYTEHGFTPEEAMAWYQGGIDPAAARHWARHSWQPDQVQRLIDHLGIVPSRTPGDPACPVWTWCKVATVPDRDAGAPGPEIALLLLAAGLTPGEASSAATAIKRDAASAAGLATMAALRKL